MAFYMYFLKTIPISPDPMLVLICAVSLYSPCIVPTFARMHLMGTSLGALWELRSILL